MRTLVLGLGLCLVLAWPGRARAHDTCPQDGKDDGNGGYAEALAGPALATYFPIDPGAPYEHLATGGMQLVVGGGRGWRFGVVRLDLGVRVQLQTIAVSGRYDADTTNDGFRARYTFLAPLVRVALTTQVPSRVNGTFGIALGTATFFSERQGARGSVSQIPVYGSFELGMVVTATDWLEALAIVAWQPPFGGPSVIAPEVGFRARF